MSDLALYNLFSGKSILKIITIVVGKFSNTFKLFSGQIKIILKKISTKPYKYFTLKFQNITIEQSFNTNVLSTMVNNLSNMTLIYFSKFACCLS